MPHRGGTHATAVLVATVALLLVAPALRLTGNEGGLAGRPVGEKPAATVASTDDDAAGAEDGTVAAALELSRLAHPEGEVAEVALGRADVFSDTLAAGSLTGQPVLLTPGDRLDPRTAEELDRLGAEHVTVLGGTEAISAPVVEELERRGYTVSRLAGADRIQTALSVARRHHPEAEEGPVVLARAFGEDTQGFADALGGSALAHDLGSPVLLTPTDRLHEDVADYLVEAEASEVLIAGGPAAVSPRAEEAIEALGIPVRRAAGDTRTGTAVAQNAARGLTHASEASTVLLLDGYHEDAWASALAAGAWAASSDAAVVLSNAGRLDGGTTGFLADAPATDLRCAPVLPTPGCDAAGRAMHLPPFAAVGGVTLRQPSTDVELIGFHQSNHEGARQLDPMASAPPTTTLDSRERRAASRSAADIVMHPDRPVRAPVSGTVVRAGTYVLYCDHRDDYAVIEPDSRPGWEVKLLHIDGVRVSAGDRVEAGSTIVAPGPTPLPFASQVDERSADRDWPHVHLEVVDPSIPNEPSGGSC